MLTIRVQFDEFWRVAAAAKPPSHSRCGTRRSSGKFSAPLRGQRSAVPVAATELLPITLDFFFTSFFFFNMKLT